MFKIVIDLMYNNCTKPKKNFDPIYVYVFFVNSAMKTLTTSLEGKSDQHVPRWIEVKVSHYIINIGLSD